MDVQELVDSTTIEEDITRVRNNVVQLLAESASSNKISDYRKEYQRLKAAAEENLNALEEALQQRRELELRLRALQQGIAVQELDAAKAAEQRACLACSPWSSLPVDLSVPRNLSSPVCGVTSSSICLQAFPDPSKWDDTWMERVKGFSATDLALLHKQHLQEVAVILPSAKLWGADSMAFHKLQEVIEHYGACARCFMDLNPVAWEQRGDYNMDTLMHAEKPDSDTLMTIFYKVSQPSEYVTFLSFFQQYNSKVEALQAEANTLLQQYKSAGGSANLQPKSSPSTSSVKQQHRAYSGSTLLCSFSQPDSCEPGRSCMAEESLHVLDELAAALEKNLRKQHAATKQLWYLMRQSIQITQVAEAALMIYPTPMSLVDFFLRCLPVLKLDHARQSSTKFGTGFMPRA